MSFYFKKKFNMFNFIIIIVVITIFLSIFRYYIIPKILFPYNHTNIIEKYSEEYNVPISLILAVINVESNFDEEAVSNKGAKGLMQIMDITGEWAAEEIGIENFTTNMLFEPEINIQIGCWYINRLNKQFNNEKNTVLAAYNAGSGNVSKWLENINYSSDNETLYDIPFEQTKNYVKKVNLNEKIYKSIYQIE